MEDINGATALRVKSFHLSLRYLLMEFDKSIRKRTEIERAPATTLRHEAKVYRQLNISSWLKIVNSPDNKDQSTRHVFSSPSAPVHLNSALTMA